MKFQSDLKGSGAIFVKGKFEKGDFLYQIARLLEIRRQGLRRQTVQIRFLTLSRNAAENILRRLVSKF